DNVDVLLATAADAEEGDAQALVDAGHLGVALGGHRHGVAGGTGGGRRFQKVAAGLGQDRNLFGKGGGGLAVVSVGVAGGGGGAPRGGGRPLSGGSPPPRSPICSFSHCPHASPTELFALVRQQPRDQLGSDVGRVPRIVPDIRILAVARLPAGLLERV